MPLPTAETIETFNDMFCSRCGSPFMACPHIWATGPYEPGVTITRDKEKAARIAARYAFGRRFNPDHDTTSYDDAP
jgi:hypothetical protein